MKCRSFFRLSVKMFFLILMLSQLATAQTAPTLSTIKESQKINGFTASAVYLNDAGEPMGGRFIHDRTGFTLDLLQIESVPQTFIWVNSFPVSDKGEPHTQEHLLITKGNKGHQLNTRETMSLTVSNAFTSQIFTAYHFNTAAGGDVFYKLFEEYVDALLHPDYTDEEVHREVCNWGVAEDAATKELKIEEKGSVYNEMKTTMNNPYAQVYNSIGRLLYGNEHPLSLNSGGLPDGIRVLNAADIKKFHDRNYHLGNMGAIISLPKTMTLASVLKQTDAILNRLQPQDEQKIFSNEIPAPKPAPAGTIQIAEYPSGNEQEPGVMLFAYPANLTLSARDELMLNNFLNIFAGDASTNLYKKFIDGKTREMDLGAQGVYGYADNNMGQPVFIGLTDVNTASLTKEKALAVWQKIQDELSRIATFKDGSEELKEFNQRFKNSLTDYQRSLAKFTNTPPKFGGRTTGDSWYTQIEEMKKIKDFKKSVILKPQFEEVDKLIAGGKNFWGEYFNRWKLLTPLPYAVLGKANSKLLQQQDSAAKQRAAAEISVLKAKYMVTDDQQAIRQYKADYDSSTALLEKAEQAHTIKFIDNPPLTLDDQLDFKTTFLKNKIPLTASTFNNMSSATTGIAFKLDKLPEDKFVYLAMLPQLITQIGIIRNGKAISYEDMSQLERQQILSLDCYYSTNFRTGRAELVVKGSGNNKTESMRAIQWMNDVLQNPYWKTENLSRIRDLVNQQLSGERKTMQNPEETWVNDPASAYRVQDNPLLLSTSSFLTTTHNILRLRWMLMDGGSDADRNATAQFLDQMAGIKASKEDLEKLTAKMQNSNDTSVTIASTLTSVMDAFNNLNPKSKQTIIEAAKDLAQALTELPDESLASDWQYLCKQMKQDLLQTPEKTLADLDEVRKNILHSQNARMFVIASGATQTALKNNIDTLLSGLSADAQQKVTLSSKKIITERYQQRTGGKDDIVYAGLINPNSATGVFINSVPLVTYADTSREKLLQFLAAQLFGGAGKQSVYTKSTGAGLSYSTGVGSSPGSGLFRYYAERTPLLPQTLGFVIDEIKRTPDDPSMSEYIISLSVSAVRSSLEYEIRGESMASDITDGITPAVVSNFRRAVLRLRKMPGLMDEVYKHKDAVYEKILPGYGVKEKETKGGNYFVIGAEKQMTAYETYLKSKDGTDTKLCRIYPRDYWITGE